MCVLYNIYVQYYGRVATNMTGDFGEKPLRQESFDNHV